MIEPLSVESRIKADDEARQKRMERWRTVFGSELGMETLLDILSALHCLETAVPTQEVIYRQNVGHWILAELGIMQSGQEDALVKALFSIPPRLNKALDTFMAQQGIKE